MNDSMATADQSRIFRDMSYDEDAIAPYQDNSENQKVRGKAIFKNAESVLQAESFDNRHHQHHKI